MWYLRGRRRIRAIVGSLGIVHSSTILSTTAQRYLAAFSAPIVYRPTPILLCLLLAKYCV